MLCWPEANRSRRDSNHRYPKGKTVFKTVANNSQVTQKQALTDSETKRLQTSLQRNPENASKSAVSPPDDLGEIVAFWPELPEHIKAAIKALTETSQSEQKRE